MSAIEGGEADVAFMRRHAAFDPMRP